MKFRYIASIVLIMTLILVAGCCGSTASNNSPPAATSSGYSYTAPTAVPTAAPTAAPTPVVTPTPVHLSGSGQSASQKFHLDSGLAVFNMKYSGSENFAIWLMDSNGNKDELLVNTIGSFDGSKAFHVSTPGDYILDITASGPWTVDVNQPMYTTASGVPVTLSGRGQAVSQPFYLNSGLATFKMKHDGSSNYAIWLDDAKGNHVELLVNEIGTFDGSKALGVKSGVYLLDIEADGDWQVQIN